MFDDLVSARDVISEMARSCDAGAFTGSQAARMLDELGAIRRLVDGMVGQFARRVAETGEHLRWGERNAATLVGKSLGVTPSEARDAIDCAARVEALPELDAAVRTGRLCEGSRNDRRRRD
jgi:hypothetical protein